MTVSVSACRGGAVELHEMRGGVSGCGQPISPSLPLSSIVNLPILNARRLGRPSTWRSPGKGTARAGFSGPAAHTGNVARWRRPDSIKPAPDQEQPRQILDAGAGSP